MAARPRTLWWAAAGLLVAVLMVVAMYFIARGARAISDDIRQDLDPPGPPVARANLRDVLGDVPVAPFFALDEAATNDRAVRLQTSLLLGRGRAEWIIVFRSAEPYSTAAAWYQRHLNGWAVDAPDNSSAHRERERKGILELGWTRNGDRLMLVYLPERPGEMLLFVSSPPPRLRGAR